MIFLSLIDLFGSTTSVRHEEQNTNICIIWEELFLKKVRCLYNRVIWYVKRLEANNRISEQSWQRITPSDIFKLIWFKMLLWTLKVCDEISLCRLSVSRKDYVGVPILNALQVPIIDRLSQVRRSSSILSGCKGLFSAAVLLLIIDIILVELILDDLSQYY